MSNLFLYPTGALTRAAVVAIAASACVVAGFMLLVHKLRHRFWLTAILHLGGTVLHELAHHLVGLLLGAQPGGISLWPKKENGMWVLGTASFRNLNLFNGAFIGLAPLLLFWLGYLLLVNLAVPLFEAHSLIAWLLVCYLIAGCLFSGIPSIVDITVTASSLLLYLSLAGLLFAMRRHFS